MKIVFLGATRGMGRALARLLAERGEQLFLIGRNSNELKKSARDLEARGAKGSVETASCDLLKPKTFQTSLEQAAKALGNFDTVIVSAAAYIPQEDLERDHNLTEDFLTINFTNTILFCEHARGYLLKNRYSTLCVFSSTAGERGRKPVILYGATKAGISRYMEGLDTKFRAYGFKAICVKPSFVTTSMTANMKPPMFVTDPKRAAKQVLRAIDRGTPEIYVPEIWCSIMRVIRNLPRSVMRNMDSHP
jgi:decaprenylphospho-beta-D-erythro-pentofuranosid-2-ulose 2-reductase